MELASDNPGLVLDHKARLALIAAVRFQLAAWEARREADMNEDDYADLQNDIGYLGMLLSRLEDEHARRSAARTKGS